MNSWSSFLVTVYFVIPFLHILKDEALPTAGTRQVTYWVKVQMDHGNQCPLDLVCPCSWPNKFQVLDSDWQTLLVFINGDHLE
jgi:hypothetical protein